MDGKYHFGIVLLLAIIFLVLLLVVLQAGQVARLESAYDGPVSGASGDTRPDLWGTIGLPAIVILGLFALLYNVIGRFSVSGRSKELQDFDTNVYFILYLAVLLIGLLLAPEGATLPD